ncbi:MAG: hypothetical protein U5L96_19390 [Owenweeksia sp.]|nr:hypothetical protein [Owenweeksia sp.]
MTGRPHCRAGAWVLLASPVSGLPLLALGFPMLFSGREKLKLWGEVIGWVLLILFLGLNFMKASVAGLRNEELLSWIQQFSYIDQSYISQIATVLLFVVIGAVLTIAVQSSSAAMALTLVMTSEGWISFSLAAAIILGENIGTTLTANIAALVECACQTSRADYFIINRKGVGWMLLIFPQFLRGMARITELTTGLNPLSEISAIPRALALFHTSFNVINVLLLIGLTHWLCPLRHPHGTFARQAG